MTTHVVSPFRVVQNAALTSRYGGKPSYTPNVTRVLDQWTEMIDRGECFDVLYMDFSKAFDTVPHQRLLRKLASYVIGGTLLSWVEDFLSIRRQRVSVNGSLSQWLEVLSGIPQGSVLGPILFIIYVNDLPGAVESRRHTTVQTCQQHRRSRKTAGRHRQSHEMVSRLAVAL